MPFNSVLKGLDENPISKALLALSSVNDLKTMVHELKEDSVRVASKVACEGPE